MTGRTLRLVLGAVLLVGAASAQPRDVAKADALFREGRALMKKGDFETACPKLEESYRLDPAAGTGINLGDCFEKQGKVASALLAYQAARALLRPGDPRLGPVEKEIAALDKRAPRLTIKLAPGAPDGTKVKRGGREVEAEKLGAAVAVNPGKYKIVVSAPGRDAAVFRVSLVEGKSRELEVGPGEEVQSVPPKDIQRNGSGRKTGTEADVRGHDGSTQRSVGYVALGVSGVLLMSAGYFRLRANGYRDDANDTCPGSPCANKEHFEELQASEREQVANAWIALGGSGGAFAIGLVLILLASNDDQSSQSTSATVSLGGDGTRLTVTGNW